MNNKVVEDKADVPNISRRLPKTFEEDPKTSRSNTNKLNLSVVKGTRRSVTKISSHVRIRSFFCVRSSH